MSMQFYSTMGVPSVLVVLAWLQANQRAARLETTMDSLAVKLRGEMRNLAKDMRGEMITLRDTIHRDMIGLHERTARVEERIK